MLWNSGLEGAAESYNVLGRVRLDVVYGAGREGDPEFERACREWMRRREAARPCDEVSRGRPRRPSTGAPPSAATTGASWTRARRWPSGRATPPSRAASSTATPARRRPPEGSPDAGKKPSAARMTVSILKVGGI